MRKSRSISVLMMLHDYYSSPHDGEIWPSIYSFNNDRHRAHPEALHATIEASSDGRAAD